MIELQTALAWALVHSLWQGSLAAVLLFGVLWVLPSARARYAAACLALVAVTLAFAVTLFREMPGEFGLTASGPIALPPRPDPGAGDLPVFRYDSRFGEMLHWLVPFWVAGVFFFHVRNLASVVGASRLRRRGVCPAGAVWQARLAELRAELQVSRTGGVAEVITG